LEEIHRQLNTSYVGFVAGPAAALSIMEYFMAFDTLMGLDYRIEKMQRFSTKTLRIIREDYGVP
jgi:hypothetical protein